MKILIIIFILIINFFSLPNTTASDYAYAQVIFDDVYLYKTANDVSSLDNIKFIIDKTYFVKVKAKEDDFYAVEYNSIEGYVKKDMVRFVSKTPQTKYVENKSFRIYGEQSRSLRTEPTSINGTESLIEYLPLYTKNLIYIGKIHGEEIIADRTDIWYFCKYVSDEVVYGYVYSDMCDQMTAIPLNTESVTYVSEPAFLTASEIQPISKKNTNIIIGILCVPALIFTFFIIKSEKVLSSKNNESKYVKRKEIGDF